MPSGLRGLRRQPHLAHRGVAGDDRRQVDLDAAGDGRARQVGEEVAHRGKPCADPDALLPAILAGIGETHLRAIGADQERGLRPDVELSRAVGNIRLLDRSGLEPEFLHRQQHVVEGEAAAEPMDRNIALLRRQGEAVALDRHRLGAEGAGVDAELAGIVRQSVLDAGMSIGLQHHRIGIGTRAQAHTHALLVVRQRARRQRHLRRHPVEAERAGEPPRPDQRAGGDFRVDIAQPVGAPAGGVAQRDLAVGYGQLLERDLLHVDRDAGPHRPVEPPFLVDLDDRAGPVQPHVEDQDLAIEERRQLGIHRKALDGHRRLVALARHLDLGEGHRGKRQQARRGRSADLHIAPEDARHLALEIAAIGRPVDEIRPDQRRRQRQDDQSADGDEEPGQFNSPERYEMRTSVYPHERVDKEAIRLAPEPRRRSRS